MRLSINIAILLSKPLFLLAFLMLANTVVANDERLQAIQEQIHAKQQELALSSNKLERLQYQLGKSARAINDAKRILVESVNHLKSLQSKIAILNKRANTLSQKYSQQLSLLADSLRSIQGNYHNYKFRYLLNADDWNSFERRAVYYDYFNKEKQKKLAILSGELSELADTRLALSEQNSLLKAERDRHHQILQTLERRQLDKRHAINALQLEIKQNHAAIALLENDAKRLQGLVERLGELSASSLQFSTLKGNLPWPIEGHINIQHNNDSLPGVFLPATVNTEVKSVHAGRVVFSDWFRSYGMLLIIDHGNGYMSLYANNEALYKDTGEAVLSGERIAEVGTGGTSGESGLYFEIRQFDKQLNPKVWCTHR